MRENLEPSLKLLFGHEGGYVNAKTDRGGPTKYGITHKTLAAHRGVKSVTAEEVKALTLGEAATIYRGSYWGPSGGDVLPSGLDYAAFDFGVNSGPQRAVKTLQKVLKVKQDGWIGEGTLAAVEAYPGGTRQLIRDYCDARMAYLESLKGPQGFRANGRGWTIRVTGKDPKGEWKSQPGVIGHALNMASNIEPPAQTIAAAPAPGSTAKAEPGKMDAFMKPEVVLPAAGTVATAAAPLAMGSTAIQWAIAIGIVVLVGLGAFFIYRRIRASS